MIKSFKDKAAEEQYTMNFPKSFYKQYCKELFENLKSWTAPLQSKS